ncbi:PHP domain-containing protein [Pseudoflavonifractor sp. MSJ-37]|uniref:PHP domain-containing protein n=1 Tax=Pseudoflavonifractor sp. MSJ-37 TaxID=2841531 RepID=UPI001C118BBF|nr:PHP domain-containing protein [Pseudoflavonifractor sp. MSJ-37]MBU5434331.1 PHP domain-containing protein [Pseudoflavonifractor sp. MSJ-37]
MLVDMHLHEKTCSSDSFLSLEEIVTIARARGLDAVCITDHDSMGLRDYAAEYSRKVGFPIFVGVEFFSLQGDITAWGIENFPDHRIDAQPFIDQVNAAGGFCVSCHPFRNNKRGLEEHLRKVKGLHGVEVLNGSTDLEANRTALRYCRELGLQAIGASDAHVPENVAKYVTWLPERVDDLTDFLAQLHSCTTKPAIWNGSAYDVVETF